VVHVDIVGTSMGIVDSYVLLGIVLGSQWGAIARGDYCGLDVDGVGLCGWCRFRGGWCFKVGLVGDGEVCCVGISSALGFISVLHGVGLGVGHGGFVFVWFFCCCCFLNFSILCTLSIHFVAFNLMETMSPAIA